MNATTPETPQATPAAAAARAADDGLQAALDGFVEFSLAAGGDADVGDFEDHGLGELPWEDGAFCATVTRFRPFALLT